VDASRLGESLVGQWPTGDLKLTADAKLSDQELGRTLTLDGIDDFATATRGDATNVGGGDFTIAGWIQPTQLRKAAIFAAGAPDYTHGWYFEMPDTRGTLRLETVGPDGQSNGSLSTLPGMLRNNTWQHVAAVVRRTGESRIYLNGYVVAKGEIRGANLDNPKLDLQFGRLAKGPVFRGDMAAIRLYRRALGEPELQALIEPGRQHAQAPPERPRDLTLTLGGRQFVGVLQPAFLAVRLPAGALNIGAKVSGVAELDRITFTPIDDAALLQRFAAFEKRAPKLGVHLGLRRDCGSTFAPVGPPQLVKNETLTQFVFEGAIRNFPSPDVEKDNVNYLAGIREIAVRSEYTDGRDMPRLLIRSVEFEGPFYEQWPPPAHRNIFTSNQPREILRQFAARAYRRPPTAAEEASLLAVYEKSGKSGRNFRDSVKDALLVALTSPQFLFLIEKSSTPGPEPLDAHELSSKLSYFLWNAPPDAATRRLAAAGALRAQLKPETDRLIADPRFTQFAREFTSQWLALDKIQVLEPDRGKFPRLTRDMRGQLRQEPIEFVRHLMLRNLPVRQLIDSDFIVVNEAVANYYDLAGKTESGFDFVAVPRGRVELGGLLTQPAILAGLSDGRESNPVKRGAWLARRIVAEPPDDPPPNVPALKEDASGLTLRQRIEQHRNQAGCRQCHTKIDPWGVAFEEFDAGGRLKMGKIDAHSQLPDKTEVAGMADLKRYLAQDREDQVAFSVLKHLTTYATGRTLTYQELNHLKQDARLKLKPTGYRMKDMLHYVVQSKPFLEK
jgi:hypothetical protein